MGIHVSDINIATTISKLLGLDMIGVDSDFSTNMIPQEDVILRMDKKYPIADYFPYLIVSDNIRTLDNKTDLFIIDPFQRKDTIKRKVKSGLGIEISIASARKLEAVMAGRWLKEVKSIYEFCQSNNCQFILASGATSVNEMISARSFDSILNVIGISPRIYWKEISEWLYAKSKARWYHAKS
ncbi:MAG TPA: hypothetical protein VFU67_02160 [Nitrososphaeraceae archaeon]|jgi:hypothetical protein|nr:hypothetical protein [Nitrososphaeraceae archaeon]